MPDGWGQRIGARRQCGGATGTLCVFAAAGGVALALAGCASQPQRYGSFTPTAGGYDSKLGVRASDKVIADGAPVPKGGGTYLVGRPYVVAGRRYFPSERPFSAIGIASWYGDAFQGRRTANGEVFDKRSVTAAHTTMPLPSYARVTNLLNDRSIIVRVNDRGPYAAGRVMDVSERVAEALDFKNRGTARVKVEYIGRASLEGSDDERLFATLRTDGTAAALDGAPDAAASLFAQAAPEWPHPPAEQAPSPPEPAPARMVAEAGDAGSDAAAADPGGTTIAVRAPLPPARPFELGSSRGALPMTALALAPKPRSPREAAPTAAQRPDEPDSD